MRQEILGWDEVERLIDSLLPQLQGTFEAIMMITRGGLVQTPPWYSKPVRDGPQALPFHHL